MLIYLDNCCLSRPFDDPSQDRIRLESEAVLLILDHVRAGDFILVSSDALLAESARCKDASRRKRVGVLLELAATVVGLTDSSLARASQLQDMGVGVFDSYHLVAAEQAHCDVMLTTDDRLLRLAARFTGRLRVRVSNPLDWIREVISDEDE